MVATIIRTCPNVLDGSRRWLSAAGTLRYITIRALRTKQEEASGVHNHNAGVFHSNLDRMKLRPPRPPRSLELNRATAQISTCVKKRDFVGAWQVYESISEPDDVLHDAALNLCAKAFWTDRAAQIWDRMQPDQKSVISYTSMMDLHGRHRHIDEVQRLLDEMTKKELGPNIVTYNVLIKAYSMARQPQEALTAFRSVQNTLLQEAGLETKQAVYTSVMTAFARSGDYAMAREIFVEMARAGLEPNHAHYNSLMSACACHGHAEIANQVFEMMKQRALTPRVEDYNILISCCRNDLDRCRELMAELHDANLQPLPRTYQELLQAYVLANDTAGAKSLVTEAADRLDRGSRKVQRLLAELAVLPD